jgi:hypothetical protein
MAEMLQKHGFRLVELQDDIDATVSWLRSRLLELTGPKAGSEAKS